MSITMQLRVDPGLSAKIKATAANQQVSVNKFVTIAIESYLAAEKEREWREGFEAMGRDPDTNSVEYMLPAAREVLFGD